MFGFLNKKLKPTRQRYTEAATQSVADLDALLVEPVSFKLHGKMHTINPLSVEQFMLLSSALVEIVDLQKKEGLTSDELIERYYGLVTSVCDTVTKDDIREMSQQQVSALFNLIIETITGKLFVEKKNLKETQAQV